MSKEILSWEEAVSWLLEQPEKEDLVRSCYFDRPVLEAVKRYANSEEWQEAVSWLPEKVGTALDIGAGNGIVSYALAVAGWNVAALEPDPSDFVGAGAIRKIANSEQLSIEVVEEFGEAIPFNNQKFDLVVARQVLHHADDLNKMFSEISRVLKPGGMALCLRDHVIDSEKGLEVFKRKHPLHSLYGGENAFRMREYEDGLNRADLRIVKRFQHFDSVINYAPNSEEDLKKMFSSVGLIWPIKTMIHSILSWKPLMKCALYFAGKVDFRQGRLVSFVCIKGVDKH